VDGKYLAVDGRCPRCGFDLFKGKLLDDAEVWGPEPHVSCPTCAATYSLKTGKFGPEYKATGLAGFVNTWAKTATIGNGSKNVLAFVITRDEETGKVYYRER
jgi:nitrite reductase/ring-hydroxylating ferredoxin subunit